MMMLSWRSFYLICKGWFGRGDEIDGRREEKRREKRRKSQEMSSG